MAREIVSPCYVSAAWDPRALSGPPEPIEFAAVWDTGATNTMISQRVVDACALIPRGAQRVIHLGGIEDNVPLFLVDIRLPNNLSVTELLVGLHHLPSFTPDVLIGMDVITQGDLAITNYNGHTRFTFRAPPQPTLDFQTRP